MSIFIRKKALKSGRISLYLDISMGGHRWKEYLGIYLEHPNTPAIRRENRAKEKRAEQLRMERERALFQNGQSGMGGQRSQEADFFELFEEFAVQYRRRDVAVVRSVCARLHRFYPYKHLPLSVIDREFCEEFLAFLHQSFHGNTPVGYFKKFKMCLERCVTHGLFPQNPARKIRLVCSEALVKEILSPAEIQRLADTPEPHTELKRAFLFACHTGLRWCDVRQLTYKNIDFTRGVITVCQQKVMGHSSHAVLHLNMNSTTVSLLRLRTGKPDEQVFSLPSYSYTRRVLLAWTKRAGINKHITFHCARHSFITNLLIEGANIKTASLLAGHSTIRHTEKYVHIIDDLKRKAVESLPPIDLTNF